MTHTYPFVNSTQRTICDQQGLLFFKYGPVRLFPGNAVAQAIQAYDEGLLFSTQLSTVQVVALIVNRFDHEIAFRLHPNALRVNVGRKIGQTILLVARAQGYAGHAGDLGTVKEYRD